MKEKKDAENGKAEKYIYVVMSEATLPFLSLFQYAILIRCGCFALLFTNNNKIN